jgi:hypothetical protein
LPQKLTGKLLLLLLLLLKLAGMRRVLLKVPDRNIDR